MSTLGDVARLVERYRDLAVQGDLDALDDICTPDFIHHTARGTTHGLSSFKRFVANVRARYPDLSASTVDVIVANGAFEDGPRVGALATVRGRNPDSGRRMEVREIWIFRVSKGKLAERWFVAEIGE